MTSLYSPRPFTIAVADGALEDLRSRIAKTRWPDAIDGADWDYGSDRAFLEELLAYWAGPFDWRAQEQRLNRLPQFLVEIDDLTLHFVHVRGGPKAVPLLLLHGWPMTFVQMERIIPLLTSGEPSFDVVVPSLPGYGFSGRPRRRGLSAGAAAELFTTLMTDVLGYERFGVRSSDIGAGVAAALPHGRLIGTHTSGTNPFLEDIPADLSDAEKRFVQDLQAWVQAEFAYALEHSTKPQTLAFGLNDSPAGLAAWIVEKLRAWSDCGGQVERVFSKDDICTNLTIYWASETIGSSMRLYYESMRDWTTPDDAALPVPTGVAMFPRDMIPTPRAFAERQGPIDHWTEMPRGGHFGEWEDPELLADDIRAFFAEYA